MNISVKTLLNTISALYLFSFPVFSMVEEIKENSPTHSSFTAVAVSNNQPENSNMSAGTAPQSMSNTRSLLPEPTPASAYTSASASSTSTTTHKSASEKSSSGSEKHEVPRDPLDFSLGKFKLGLEFQEISGLCKWALQDSRIQKKPLFCLRERGTNRQLWHVVIDGEDIEFVTEPFSYNERPSLEKCVNTILLSCNALEYLFVKNNGEVTFKILANKLYDLFKEFPYFVDYVAQNYSLTQDQPLTCSSSPWKPRFSAQATIQHRLESTIPLYFGLFGFSSPYMPYFSASLPFRESFLEAHKNSKAPILNELIVRYQQKLNGLVFLHALTLVQMSEDKVNPRNDDALLKETYLSLKRSHQVDAKSKLTLMSRRPFSSMVREIVKQEEGLYSTYFYNALMNRGANDEFAALQIPLHFTRTNYAEQFFDPKTGAEKRLLNFLPCFRKDFLEEHGPMIEHLLGRGVISTTMLRNFNKNINIHDPNNLFRAKKPIPVVELFPEDKLKVYLENYSKIKGQESLNALNKIFSLFILTLNSVDFPEYRINIDPDNARIGVVSSTHDLLSPPCCLEDDNSMGKYKDDVENEYGDALIEVRGISNVQPWFLKKCGLDPEREGEFLKKPDIKYIKQISNSLPQFERCYKENKGFYRVLDVIESYILTPWGEESLKLFDFLNNFGTQHHDFYEIYYLGMFNALKHESIVNLR